MDESKKKGASPGNYLPTYTIGEEEDLWKWKGLIKVKKKYMDFQKSYKKLTW